MPNWCENQLTITGPHAMVAEWVQAMQGVPVHWPDSFDDPDSPTVFPLCFHRGVPVPPDIVQKGFSPTGYHWCSRHWGTKWEPNGPDDVPLVSVNHDGSATAFYLFDTAWSPPIAWLNTVALQWPALSFSLLYGEPGVQAYGEYLWLDGQCVQEEIIDPETQSEWIAEHFGAEFNEDFDDA